MECESMINLFLVLCIMVFQLAKVTHSQSKEHKEMDEMDAGHVNTDELNMDQEFEQSDWLPVGQMVTDLGKLFRSEQRKAHEVKLDDENSDDMSYRICKNTLHDFAKYPKYLTNQLVKIYTSNETLDYPEHLEAQQLKNIQGFQDKIEQRSLTADDLDAAAKVLLTDESEVTLREELEVDLRESGQEPLDSDFVTRLLAAIRALQTLEDLRCRNLCTSSVCMEASDLCSINTCRVRRCPIFCYVSNLRYPMLNLCGDRPNVVYHNHMYCCPHRFHPKLNTTGEVKCYC